MTESNMILSIIEETEAPFIEVETEEEPEEEPVEEPEPVEKLSAKERAKIYRKKFPERWKATITKYHKKKWTCKCGVIVCNKVRPKHLKSVNHIERMELIKKYSNINNNNLLEKD
tara:strand:+ start:67 stop:411 length:345 start_codon:yes stop_codon:yes gene_type:complete